MTMATMMQVNLIVWHALETLKRQVACSHMNKEEIVMYNFRCGDLNVGEQAADEIEKRFAREAFVCRVQQGTEWTLSFKTGALYEHFEYQ